MKKIFITLIIPFVFFANVLKARRTQTSDIVDTAVKAGEFNTLVAASTMAAD